PSALAASALAAGAGLLAEVGGPDDIAAEAHATVETRDHRAFGGGGDAQGIEPGALDALAGGERGDDPAVHHRADGGADHAADRRSRDAEDRAADAAADGGAGRAENEGGHRSGPPVGAREQEGEGDLARPSG